MADWPEPSIRRCGCHTALAGHCPLDLEAVVSFAATISTGGSSRLSRGDNLAVSVVSVLGMMMRSSSQSIMVNCHSSAKKICLLTQQKKNPFCWLYHTPLKWSAYKNEFYIIDIHSHPMESVGPPELLLSVEMDRC